MATAARRPAAMSLASRSPRHVVMLLIGVVASMRFLQPSLGRGSSFAAVVVDKAPKAAVGSRSSGGVGGSRRGRWSFGIAGPRTNKHPRQAMVDYEGIKRMLHWHRYPSIWKEHWFGPANLDRANLRISGMDTYALIAAVLLQVLIGLYGVINDPDKDATLSQRLMFEIKMFLLLAAVLSSSFTMVMFLLNKIYSVTALAMHKDVAYRAFQRATSHIRVCAFWSLIVSIVSFILSFVLHVLSRIESKRRGVFYILTSMGVIWMLWQLSQIIVLANRHIFSN
mmetsp:Transcript_49478/g.130490  ORF Transcript_49478/g.130490 Transcript_49478/m.130490 type:complete len:281 (+) Transcript_49478:27-869(+)